MVIYDPIQIGVKRIVHGKIYMLMTTVFRGSVDCQNWSHPQEHLLGILFIETGMYFINKEELEREGGKEVALEEYDTRKGEMEIWRVIKKD